MTPATEHEHSFQSLGTTVRLLVSSTMPSALAGELIAGRVQRRLEQIHLALTRFEPASELSLLNAHGGEWVRVSEDLWQGVQAALYAAEFSDGLIDPTLLRGLERAGYAVKAFHERNLFFGGAQVAVRGADGSFSGGGDDRRGGAAIVVTDG